MPRASRGSIRAVLALLADLRCLAAAVAEVVELGAANLTARHELDLVDDRRVHRELTLHTHLEADLADDEGLANASTLTAEDNALEDLDTRTVTFNDVHVHLDGVTCAEVRDVGLEGGLVEFVDEVHDVALCSRHRSTAR